MIVAIALLAGLSGTPSPSGTIIPPPGHECRLVWDDTKRNAVFCGGRFDGYACIKGEPCSKVYLPPDPNCGRVAETVCAPKSMFKDVPMGGGAAQ